MMTVTTHRGVAPTAATRHRETSFRPPAGTRDQDRSDEPYPPQHRPGAIALWMHQITLGSHLAEMRHCPTIEFGPLRRLDVRSRRQRLTDMAYVMVDVESDGPIPGDYS